MTRVCLIEVTSFPRVVLVATLLYRSLFTLTRGAKERK